MSYVNNVVIAGWVKGGSVKAEQGRAVFQLGIDQWDAGSSSFVEQFLWVELVGKAADKLVQYLTEDKQVTLVGRLRKTAQGGVVVSAWECSFQGKKYREGRQGAHDDSVFSSVAEARQRDGERLSVPNEDIEF